MKSKLIISEKLFEKLNNLDYSEDVWTNNSITSYSDLSNKILLSINSYNSKIKAQSIEPSETGESSTNYGYFKDLDSGLIIAYFFSIPPNRSSRTAFLAQDVYPALTSIIQTCNNSFCNDVYNKPVYIFNLNEHKVTESMRINIKGALTIGLHYIDIFNREKHHKYNSLSDLHNHIVDVSKGNLNLYFRSADKEIMFLPDTLESNTNDRYYYASKVFPAAHLAINENYILNTTSIDTAPNTDNNTLNAFKEYITKIKN